MLSIKPKTLYFVFLNILFIHQSTFAETSPKIKSDDLISTYEGRMNNGDPAELSTTLVLANNLTYQWQLNT